MYNNKNNTSLSTLSGFHTFRHANAFLPARSHLLQGALLTPSYIHKVYKNNITKSNLFACFELSFSIVYIAKMCVG